MVKIKNVIALIGISLLIGAASTTAIAQSRKTRAAASRDVSQLLRMMDKDQNGVVSKEEFMDFMSQTFDRIDINKSGALERNELQRMTIPNWITPENRQEPPPG